MLNRIGSLQCTAYVFQTKEFLNHKSLKNDLKHPNLHRNLHKTWANSKVFCLQKRLWGKFKLFTSDCFLVSFSFLRYLSRLTTNWIEKIENFLFFFNYCRPTFALYKKHFYTLMKFLKLLVQGFNLLLLLLKPLQVKVNPFRINIQRHVHEIYI